MEPTPNRSCSITYHGAIWAARPQSASAYSAPPTSKRNADDRKAELTRRRKILAVEKVLQCTHCSLKCEKCGTQMEHRPTGSDAMMPYRFCEGCMDEYRDYIEQLKGRGDPDCYWHNDAWREAWQTWIDHRGATDRYLKSKEFLRLLEELRKNRSDH